MITTFLLLPALFQLIIGQQCSEWIQIRSGDCCYKIWSGNGISENELNRLNPGLNCNGLPVGDELCIMESNNLGCAEYVIVRGGDSCWSIREGLGFSERRFNDINPGLNCNALQVGQKICVHSAVAGKTSSTTTTTTKSSTSRPITTEDKTEEEEDLFEECAENYTIQTGDLCWKIVRDFGLNETSFAQLNPGLDCNLLQTGENVCVSFGGCQLRHTVVGGETCYSISMAFKTSTEDLVKMNNISCDILEVGRKLCVWDAGRGPGYNVQCVAERVVKSGDSCWRISIESGITVDELLLLNPLSKCSNLKEGERLCTKAAGTSTCASYRAIGQEETCEYVAGIEGIPLELLIQLNPSIDCEKANEYQQLCIGRGLFSQSSCLRAYRIAADNETCSTVSSSQGVSVIVLQTLNPSLNCSRPLDRFSLVCTSGLTGTDKQRTADDLFEELRSAAPSLFTAYTNFKTNPSLNNNDLVFRTLIDEITTPQVYSVLKRLHSSNANMRQFLESASELSRQDACKEIKGTKVSEKVQSCLCGSTDLYLYCQALLAQEIFKEDNSLRKKRKAKSPCSIKTSDGCFGGGCSFPAGFVEISVNAEICAPVTEIIDNTIKFCTNDYKGFECTSGDKLSVAFLNTLVDRKVTGGVSICLTAFEIIRKLADAGEGVCFHVLKAEYTPFVGRLDVGAALDIVVIKLKGGAVIKTHPMVLPDMCQFEDYACQDYCLWEHYNEPNGRAYGYFEARLFSLFGIFEGIKIADYQFNKPKLAGCEKDKEIAILLLDQRHCKEESVVWVRCNSGNDKMEFKEVSREPIGLAFKPHILGKTLFYCEFVDQHDEKLGFDVYGGKSKNKAKKGNFYYAVRNDGIYHGTERDNIDKLVMKWSNPCEGVKDEDVDTGEGGFPDQGGAEPTGSSSVPAASCGKRIVGYYTGWGQREVSIDQLKKLTHVVFAFIATFQDGRIGFGTVSDDDNNPEAIAKAERRFHDLKSKVRRANGGVKILFAVGGWENSQYFSGIAGNSGKRRTFIDSVVQFIKENGVDGVDIDWEYPVTGGAVEGVAGDKGEWTIRPGYNLQGIMQYADYINVMTYDYYGAWGSKWGAYTGPPSPLFYGSPKGFSGKLNADFTMKYYSCRSKRPSKVNMGVPFYGRYWENVGAAIEDGDDMWRTADEVGGKFQGGYVAWRNIGNEGWSLGSATVHEKTKAPFIWNAGARKFLGFENPESLRHKVNYAMEKNLGGLMIWAIDLDDDADTMLSIVSSADLCSGGSGDSISYECVPIEDVRWWTPENSDEATQGQCGKYAPLINGFYPVCDPDDPGYVCCGTAGYCGSGDEFCTCDGCVDYRTSPSKILDEPTKPTRPITWHTQEGMRERCGKDAPPVNGETATCNPDSGKPCCSNGFYCGVGPEYCECDGCVDYRK